MTTLRQVIDKVLNDMFDQVPTMAVEKVTLTPPKPTAGQDVTVRIDVSGNRYVICELRTADGQDDAMLCSARVIEC